MKLRTDNREFEVVQSGGTILHLKSPETFPSGPAVLEISIDGESTYREFEVDAVESSIKVFPKMPKPSAVMVAEP